VERHSDDLDRHASRLWLTSAGRAALKRAKSGLVELNARLAHARRPEEARTAMQTHIDFVRNWLERAEG
jgi:DNA-binding FadR family transcriptional regulator